MTGIVVSRKMDKTAMVSVSRRALDPVFKKYLAKKKIYPVHDESNVTHVGDTVEIVETRPLSRTKRWKINKVISSFKGEERVEL